MLLYQNISDAMYGSGFADKVRLVSKNLGIDPNWLMALMKFESNLKTTAVNKYSNATGLIQFMPKTAIGLNTTVEDLKTMAYWNQLNYVEKYYQPYKRKISQAEDLYLVTFYPYALGRPDSYILGSQVSTGMVRKIAEQNKIFDHNKDFRISLAELKRSARNLIFKDLPEYKSTPQQTTTNNNFVAPAPTPAPEKKSNKNLFLFAGLAVAAIGGNEIIKHQKKKN